LWPQVLAKCVGNFWKCSKTMLEGPPCLQMGQTHESWPKRIKKKLKVSLLQNVGVAH